MDKKYLLIDPEGGWDVFPTIEDIKKQLEDLVNDSIYGIDWAQECVVFEITKQININIKRAIVEIS